MTEQQKLDAAVDTFAVAMKKRLSSKRRDGRGGWDTGSFTCYDLPVKLLTKAAQVATLHHRVAAEVLVDIANIAMFLHKKVKDWEARMKK